MLALSVDGPMPAYREMPPSDDEEVMTRSNPRPRSITPEPSAERITNGNLKEGSRASNGAVKKEAEIATDEAHAELRQTLRLLVDQIGDLLIHLPEEPALSSIQPSRIRESLEQATTLLDKPTFVVAFAGAFNAGKSTLINALLGKDLLRSSNQPTTSTITRITGMASGPDEMTIHYFSHEQYNELFDRYYQLFAHVYTTSISEDLPHEKHELNKLLEDIDYLQSAVKNDPRHRDDLQALDTFASLIHARINHAELLGRRQVFTDLDSGRNTSHLHRYTSKDLSDAGHLTPLVREVHLRLYNPLLPVGCELIDLPGLGSPDPCDEEITMAALRGNEATGARECDSVVHVLDCATPFRGDEDRLFQLYRRIWGESFSKRVFLVASRFGKLEQQSPREMTEALSVVQKVVQKYTIDSKKVFFVDGQNGLQAGNLERMEIRKLEMNQRSKFQKEMEAIILPNGQNLHTTSAKVSIDGNIAELRDALQHYLTTFKEYLHLSDAIRLVETQVNHIQHVTSMSFPPLDQLNDDEEHFIRECRADIERQIKLIRAQARDRIQPFLQELLHEEVLPRSMAGMFETFFQALSTRLDQQDPTVLQDKLMTSQISGQGRLSAPGPWETFHFLLQQEVARLGEDIEQFCNAIIERILGQYRHFLFEDLGLESLLSRAFGDTPEGRQFKQTFQELVKQLGHDLRLIARNLNRMFFYEYSDVYHRRDAQDGLLSIRAELEQEFADDLHMGPADARKVTRWLLRHKMEYHFRKLGLYLPMCFLQQLQELHRLLSEQVESASYAIRHSYLDRLERREIGYEVDRIRHRYRQIRASLEKLAVIRESMQQARGLIQRQRPN